VTLIQKRIPHARVFLLSVFAAAGCLIAGASMWRLWLTSLCIVGFGMCTGSAYVLGFSLLQSEVSDELRGRIFATLYTTTRLCLFLALLVAPFLSTLFDGLSRSLLGRQVQIGGVTVHLAGVRLTLWLGGLVILAGGLLAQRAMRSASE